MLLKKVRYRNAATNTVEKSLSKTDRIEILSKSYRTKMRPKVPPKFVVEIRPYGNARRKSSVQKVAQKIDLEKMTVSKCSLKIFFEL